MYYTNKKGEKVVYNYYKKKPQGRHGKRGPYKEKPSGYAIRRYIPQLTVEQRAIVLNMCKDFIKEINVNSDREESAELRHKVNKIKAPIQENEEVEQDESEEESEA